jgi:UDP-N-acetyl-2-amino-2-deoxyglucuronate dehydrogenase
VSVQTRSAAVAVERVSERASYGVGIIGAGLVAGEYVAAFRDHPSTNVIGVYSRRPGTATRLLERHGVEAVEYPTEEALLDDSRVRIVVSCTPPDARPDHVIRAAASGRHVVIEKPVALSMEEVQGVRDAVAEAGVKSVVSFVLRWNPMIATLKRLVADGVLGEVVYAEGDYWNPIEVSSAPKPWYLTKKLGRGAFIEGGCHAIDAIRYLAGEIREVAAFSCPPKRDSRYEYDPIVVASATFENGAVGKLSAILDADTPYTFNVRLLGTRGAIQNNRVFSSDRYPGSTGYREFPISTPDSGDVTHHPFAEEIAHFLTCIEEDVESHASIHDAARTMAVAFAIERSLALGAPVRVGDVLGGSLPAAGVER